jgi:PhnB protein
MQLEPYLFFNGNCEEAITYYAKVFGGEITQLHRFETMPGEHPVPDDYKQKIMHATLETPAFKLMASDGRAGAAQKGGNISLSLGTSDRAEGERVFNALAEGGTVDMPLADQFWGARFGQLTDRFGIDWMINIALAPVSAN